MAGVWTSVALTAVSAGVNYAGAQSAAKDSRAAGAAQQDALAAIAEEERAVLGGLAVVAEKQYSKLGSAYSARAGQLIGTLKFSPVSGVLDKDANGVSFFGRTMDVFDQADALRRKEILGGTEARIRQSLDDFAKISGGDMSPITSLVRSTDAAIAATTKGSAIGYAADLGAKTQFQLRLQGADATNKLTGLLEGFYTPTATRFQTALQVSDEARREATRKDQHAAAIVEARLGALDKQFRFREQGLSSSLNLQQLAATSYSRAMTGAATAGYQGALDGIQYEGQATQALASGISGAGALALQYGGQQAALRSARVSQGITAQRYGVTGDQIGQFQNGDFSGLTARAAPAEVPSYKPIAQITTLPAIRRVGSEARYSGRASGGDLLGDIQLPSGGRGVDLDNSLLPGLTYSGAGSLSYQGTPRPVNYSY